MNPDREEDVFSDPEDLLLMRGDQEEEEQDEEEDEEEDVRIFNTWMQQYRGGERQKKQEQEEEEEEEEEEEGEGRPDSRCSLEPPVQMRSVRRSSLPCPATLSAMQLPHLDSSTCAPVSARVLLRRSSSRRLLPPPQEDAALVPTIPEATPPERQGQFRRRNVMSLSDAYSVCLICHTNLNQSSGGTKELQCTHTFHKEVMQQSNL
ncbi:histone H3.v1-like [Kryptolebias marmoratus]|uniref:histone H3.v1-like n=1 Tax=Kryptolebias marmoratus TaxID=37003 RepID=UPI0018AC934A|nr:histone H3.v1-like [Kryptolebias marmoratus]